MRRLLAALLTALFVLGAGPALALHPRTSVIPPPGYPPSRLAPMLFGNGTDGQRVQAVYVYSPIDGNRLERPWSEVSVYTQPQPPAGTTVRQVIERDAGYVDAVYLASAQAQDPNAFRRVRWVTDRTGRLDIVAVALTPGSTDAGQAEVAAYFGPRTDRIYLAWDWGSTEAACGGAPGCAGGFSGDTRPGPDNPNNTGGPQRYSVMGDTDWWNFPAPFAHELTHQLGAVLSPAPYANTRGHANIQWDVMNGTGTSSIAPFHCTDDTWYSWWSLDCTHDTYFSVLSPVPGGYLERHWNVANSVFLATGTTTGPSPTPTPSPSPSPTPLPSPASCPLRDTLPAATPGFRFCADMEIPYPTFTNPRTQFMLLCPALVYDPQCGQSWSIQYVQAGKRFTELGYTLRGGVRWAYVDGGINQYGGHDYGWLEG